MNNLQQATERICELKGSLVALDALVPALIQALPAPMRLQFVASFEAHAEAARTVMLHADISDLVLAAFDRDFARYAALLQARCRAEAPDPPANVDALLLATTRVTTLRASDVLTSASGFFYRDGGRLFVVSNRHVFCDADSAHHPDRIVVGTHTDPADLTRHAEVSIPLYLAGRPQWREARDAGGAVDIAALEVPAGSLPPQAALQAFERRHLDACDTQLAVGDALTIAGFPLGFHDTVHHLAVARSATIASSYGVRFQGQGCFLTDARMHRGSSGSPVVRRLRGDGVPALPWQLIGVHSTRMDMRTRDQAHDESLGLNCAWYADVLPSLTADR